MCLLFSSFHIKSSGRALSNQSNICSLVQLTYFLHLHLLRWHLLYSFDVVIAFVHVTMRFLRWIKQYSCDWLESKDNERIPCGHQRIFFFDDLPACIYLLRGGQWLIAIRQFNCNTCVIHLIFHLFDLLCANIQQRRNRQFISDDYKSRRCCSCSLSHCRQGK